MKSDPPSNSPRAAFGICALLLVFVLALHFRQAFRPDYTVFSNDGPLGMMASTQNRLPAILTGMWMDLNWLGGPYPAPALMLSTALRLVTTPLVLSKILCPFSLFVVGLCAWICFRQHKFSPLACLLVAVAASLNSDFFNTAAWGVCSQPIAFGMNFLALGALADTTSPRRWLRVLLAGGAVGLGVSEAYDIGALFSLFVAAYVVVQSLAGDGPWLKRVTNGFVRLALVGFCAGLIAAAALTGLVSTQIKGVAGVEQDAESKAARWSFATQYSIPKAEALGILVPGLFGYRFDTPDGGAYWGRAGSDLSWDEFVASGGQRGSPNGAFRAGAGSNYVGVLVLLLAGFGLAQSCRQSGGPFTTAQRRIVWFWGAVVVVALLLTFGRFAPFYQFFYALPYTSTIRNPAKFLHIVEWALLILFAYGAEALCRVGLHATTSPASGLLTHWKAWWTKAAGFNRNWVRGSVAALIGFGVVWLVYASARPALERHLAELTNLQYQAGGQKADPYLVAESAMATARFSVRQVGRTLLYLVPASGLVALTLSGYFAGRRARVGQVLFAALLLADLYPVNLPWVRTPNWREKYETNSIIEFLRPRAYEQRVALLPIERYADLSRLPREMAPVVQQYQFLAGLYGSEWTQHLFLYNDIQTLDIIQEPRVPADKAAFEAVMRFAPPTRRWELTNTRLLLSPSLFLDFLNQQLDAGRGRFRIATAFDLAAKPSADAAGPRLEQITTKIHTNGQLAVFDFTGALPRAKLCANWKVSTNEPAKLQTWSKDLQGRVPPDWRSALAALSEGDLATLHELAEPAFDPAQTVLLAEPLAAPPGTNQNAGTVKFESYTPKHIVLRAAASGPCVLLLNDKFDPNWHVTVDGQSAKLLRCNFIARGVFLAQAGEHQVEFHFQPPLTGFYISLAAMVVGLGLLGYVIVAGRRQQPAE